MRGRVQWRGRVSADPAEALPEHATLIVWNDYGIRDAEDLVEWGARSNTPTSWSEISDANEVIECWTFTASETRPEHATLIVWNDYGIRDAEDLVEWGARSNTPTSCALGC